MIHKTAAETSASRKRGTAKAQHGAVYRIGHETLTLRELAERIPANESVTRHRLAKLRKASGPITLERLRA